MMMSLSLILKMTAITDVNNTRKMGTSPSVMKIRADRSQYEKWSDLKTDYLDNFAMELAHIVADQHPGLKTARNLYAQVALNPYAEEWYAQGFSKSIQRYDYTAIMAMPYMEQAEDPKAFMKKSLKESNKKSADLKERSWNFKLSIGAKTIPSLLRK